YNAMVASLDVKAELGIAESVYHTVRSLVQGAKREAFQVFAFRMMEAHRVIDRLAEPSYDRNFAPRIHGGAEDDFLKQIGGNVLGAGKGEEHAARLVVSERVEV